MKNRKNKLANILKVGVLLLGISFLLWNCEGEEFIESTKVKTENHDPYTISSVLEVDLQTNLNLQKKINSLSKKLNFTYQKSASTKYNFTINKEKGKYLQSNKEEYHSYTFLVEREEPNGYLENVLFSLQPNGDYKTFLIRYKLSLEDLTNKNYNEDVLLNENEVIYESLDDSLLDALSKEEALSKNTLMARTMCAYHVVKTCKMGICKGEDIDSCSTPTFILIVTCGGGGGNSSGDSDGTTDNGDATGGGTSSSTGDTTINITSIVAPTYEEQIIDCLGSYILNSGNITVTAWLNDPETDYTQKKAVATFLNSSSSDSDGGFSSSNTETNCNNPEAIEFAVKAIEAFINDWEVDFEDRITNQIKDEKIKCLHDKLTKNGNTFVKDILANFDGESEFDINIASVDKIFSIRRNDYVNGQTSHKRNDKTIHVKISSDKLSTKSVLSGIRTILHEYIHADMYRKLNTKDTTEEIKNFKETYEKYKKERQHNTMAELYVSSIAKALKELHKSILLREYNYLSNNGAISLDNLYEALAWQGLENHGVQAYTDLPQTQKDKLNEALNIYFHSLTKNCPK